MKQKLSVIKRTAVRYVVTLLLPLSWLGLGAGCSSSEDTTPSLADINQFEPSATDQSQTAQLRREFFAQTGSYLLFSDTLADGREMLDVMNYTMFGFGEHTAIRYGYITQPDSQRLAAELVCQHLVRRLGRARPYSFLLVNSIKTGSEEKAESKLLGLRAYAISMNNGAAFNDPDTYFRAMVADMVRSKVQTLSTDQLSAFYAYSREYYSQDEDHFGLSTSHSQDTEMYPFGFFSDVYYDVFPDSSYDLRMWINAALVYTRDQFAALYGAYPIMMGKYDAMRGIIENDLGYILD